MKRYLSTLVQVCGILVTVSAGSPVVAAERFDNDDLKGEYLFTVTQARRAMLPGTNNFATEQCVVAGSAKFDGEGGVLINATQRCATGGGGIGLPQIATGTVTQSQYYVVSPDGSFLVSEDPAMTDPVHGQIVDHGRSLLLDGTTATMAETLSWSGIAMRR